MKKIMSVITMLFLFLSFSSVVHAKSYTMDKVQIKSWIQPNGDLLVNEIFTYNLDGKFTSLTRSFPDEHAPNIKEFEAYEISKENPEPGFLKNEDLKKLEVTKSGTEYRTAIDVENRPYSVLYYYKLENAVTSYDDYSKLNITYFENGEAHDQDIENVTIDFILPEPTDVNNFDGVLFDRNSQKNEKNTIGIRFTTPNSKAYTLTKTSFYFPSFLMTEQEKLKTVVSMEEAISKDRLELSSLQKRLSLIDELSSIIPIVTLLFIVIAFISLFVLPQRHFWRRGSVEDALNTDILYLFFIEKIGKPHPKSFLAGLYSMVEKGAVKVKKEKSALRFKDDPKAPEETLSFRLVDGGKTQLPYEKKMIQWLFSLKSGRNKWTFHLHDAAGAAKKEKNMPAKYHFSIKTKEFKKNHYRWHKEVEKELVEAKSFNSFIKKTLMIICVLAMTISMSVSYYADVHSTFSIGFIIFVNILFMVSYLTNKWRKWDTILYAVIMFFTATSLTNDSLVDQNIYLLFSIIVIYIVVPKYILSMNAVRAKDAVRTFKRKIHEGVPSHLDEEQMDRWVVRAYLFTKNTNQIPKIPNSTLPLAVLLTDGTDPMKYVTDTWTWSYVSTGSGSSSDSGGHYGGGGDSGGGGGGGAGAD